jgi:hypothetical protein
LRPELVKNVLSALERNELNVPIEKLFGNVIRKRLAGPYPECRLVRNLISDERNLLPRWRADFGGYIEAIGDSDLARQKVEEDLLGRAASCSSSEFDDHWGDFYAEISAVNELSKTKRFEQFVPILPPDPRTYDYDALGGGNTFAIEVKNARPPVTITDAFAAASIKHSEFSQLRIVLRYYWDNTVTRQQIQQIEAFVNELKECCPGYSNHLCLAHDVIVTVELLKGRGDVIMMRGLGGSCPEPELNEAGLLKKVSDQAEKAMKQLSSSCAMKKILVMNLVTPDGMIDQDLAMAVKGTILRKSSGQLEPILLLHHHLLAI